MKTIALFIFFIELAVGQTVLPWNNQSIDQQNVTPQQLNTDGIFFVSSYAPQGSHTDYDMARQAADAYAAANPKSGSLLVLKPGINQTCDAVPLPSLGVTGGTWGTTSIFGFGSNLSNIQKKYGCTGGSATLRHLDSPAGQLSRGWYQGFTVDANHIDSAACELYGMSLTTIFDVACGNARAGADHELEFGNRDANSLGWMDNIYIYNLKTFDTVGAGKGAQLTPAWSGGKLTGVSVVNPGAKKYSSYVRAQIIGTDLSTCTVVPALTPTLDSTGLVNGAKITNGGSCGSTTKLYVLIQDGTPAAYGMKFSNMADSHVWNLEATGSTTYGIAWLHGSNNNSIYGEHPYTNQTYQIVDYASGNRHINAFFDGPGAYGALLSASTGTFENAIFGWDGSTYAGSSGYFFNNDPRAYTNWVISNSQCTNSSTGFVSIATRSGPLAGTAAAPSGITLMNVQACDGTGIIDWPVSVK